MCPNLHVLGADLLRHRRLCRPLLLLLLQSLPGLRSTITVTAYAFSTAPSTRGHMSDC
jgi:hypothetical protein